MPRGANDATGGRDLKVNPRYIKGMPEELADKPRAEIATVYANVLYAENIRSVLHRYPDDTFESAPGLINKPEQITVTYKHFNHVDWVLKPVAILKMCDGLEYQSCETEDYESMPAYRLLQNIRRAAIRALPGYEDAPWDYDAPERKAA